MRIRTDIWATLMVTAIVMVSAGELTKSLITKYNNPPKPPEVEVQQAPEPGDIGTMAGLEIPRVSTIVEILAMEEPFTIEVTKRYIQSIGITGYWYITLDEETEEKVLAKIDRKYVQESGREDGYMCILPIGQVVYEPAPEEVLSYIAGFSHPIERTDFYVNMKWVRPEAPPAPEPIKRKQLDANGIADTVSFVLMVVTFASIRIITVRKGIFPPILPRRKKDDKL